MPSLFSARLCAAAAESPPRRQIADRHRHIAIQCCVPLPSWPYRYSPGPDRAVALQRQAVAAARRQSPPRRQVAHLNRHVASQRWCRCRAGQSRSSPTPRPYRRSSAPGCANRPPAIATTPVRLLTRTGTVAVDAVRCRVAVDCSPTPRPCRRFQRQAVPDACRQPLRHRSGYSPAPARCCSCSCRCRAGRSRCLPTPRPSRRSSAPSCANQPPAIATTPVRLLT